MPPTTAQPYQVSDQRRHRFRRHSGPKRRGGGLGLLERDADLDVLAAVAAQPRIEDRQVVELVLAHVRVPGGAEYPPQQIPQVRRRGTHRQRNLLDQSAAPLPNR